MRHVYVLIIALAILASPALTQYAQGPGFGSVASGASVNTNNFSANSSVTSGEGGKIAHRHMIIEPLPAPANGTPATGPEGSNFISDPSVRALAPPSVPPITIATFQGIPDRQSSIPPDPYLAVGPNHIIQVVNTEFRISDKNGTTLKTISASPWYNNVFPNSGAFDPKVHYDQHAGRWIMVWLQQNDAARTSNYLVSVSDDDDPNGIWWNYALPANLNGSVDAVNWADYQGVGYDRDNVYITSNQFAFGGSGQYVKLRIIPKSQLYANTGGPVTWKDFWDLRDQNFTRVFGTRPARIFGTPGVFYLAGSSPFNPGSYIVVHRISNPSDSIAAITAVNVPVTSYSSPPNANQLGGGSPLLEAGGFNVRNEPVYMDSSLWVVHSVASGAGYSAVHYVKINLLTNTASEDVALGADGFWHFFPALAVDKDKNIAITFSRSGLTEYAGAYFTWRLNSDPPNTLRPTVAIQPGKANYVKTFGGTRNRWGDYMGIALDPVDRNNFWMLTEYAEYPPANTWGVWVHGARLVPFPGSRVASTVTSRDFGLIEVGKTSDTTLVTLFNLGANPLTVSSISNSQSAFLLLQRPTLPLTLNSFDSLTFKLAFRPAAQGVVNDTIQVVSNATTNPAFKIGVRAKGVVIGRTAGGVMYAASSATSPASGQLYSINLSTGAATAIGSLGVDRLNGLAIRPSTKELYGVRTDDQTTTLYRVSRSFGDALMVRSFSIPLLRAITFGGNDTLFAGTNAGKFYRINVDTGDTTLINTPSIVFSGLAISPTSRKLWASVQPAVVGRDNIYTVNRDSGTVSLVGATGLGGITPYIAFGPTGILYALKGSGAAVNSLVRLDTVNAAGTTIGSTGVVGLLAMVMRTDTVTLSVPEPVGGEVPTTFALSQNYPNPFNPSTQIAYGLPQQSVVTLTVHNLLGQEIVRLVEGKQSAGNYTMTWNGVAGSGAIAASGVYLYTLQAIGDDGKTFRTAKKMIFLK